MAHPEETELTALDETADAADSDTTGSSDTTDEAEPESGHDETARDHETTGCSMDATVPSLNDRAPTTVEPRPITGQMGVGVRAREVIPIGSQFANRFEILAHLGKGGMSTVYKARDSAEDRIVAIKTMLPHLLEQADSVRRFQREALSASTLAHENIAQVYGCDFSDDGTPYIVMEYIEGASLTSLIQREGKLSYQRAVPIFVQIAEALLHAHERGIIHRDLKPSNVLLRQKNGNPESVSLVDFGLAKLLPTSNVEASSITNTGDVFGSPPYMSPEQCKGMRVDHRADIYAFGCLMYEVLTGAAPLLGDTPVSTIVKQMNELPAPMSQKCPAAKVPPSLDAMVLKALDKNPPMRQQSMSEIISELNSFAALQESGLEFRPLSAWDEAKLRFFRNKKIAYTALGVSAVCLWMFVSWYWEFINDWRDGTFRLIGSIAIVAVIAYGAFRLKMLDKKIRAPQVNSALPKLAWLPPRVPAGSLEEQRAILEKIYASYQSESQLNDPEMLQSLRNAFESLVLQNSFEEIDFRAMQFIELSQKNNQEQSQLSALSKEYLGDSSVNRKNLDRAESLFREAVTLWSSDGDFAKRARCIAQLKLAGVLLTKDRVRDAQALYEEELVNWGSLGLPKDATYALHYSRYADCFCAAENFKAAEQQYTKAIELWDSQAETANSALAFIKYAYTCERRWKPVEIPRDMGKAVQIVSEAFGTNSEHDAIVKGIYASNLWKEHRYLEALSVSQKA